MAYKYKEWPKAFYNAEGEMRVFSEGDTIPSGWFEHGAKTEADEKGGRRQKKAKQSSPRRRETDASADEMEQYRLDLIAYHRAQGRQVPDDAPITELEALTDAEG